MTPGGTSLTAVYWGTNDPKSLMEGGDKVVKDKAYHENLGELFNRTKIGHRTKDDNRGFRLVRRPYQLTP
jgi:hypothetical protein